MAADFNTEVVLKGTKEELLAMIKVLKRYATDKQKQYREKRDCAYLSSLDIGVEKDVFPNMDVLLISDEELNEVVDNPQKTLYVYSSGPYGVFALLDEVPIFKEMAEAAPNAYFEGVAEGFDPGGDQAVKGVLKDGLLYISTKYPGECYGDDDWDEDSESCEDDESWDQESIYNPVTKEWN